MRRAGGRTTQDECVRLERVILSAWQSSEYDDDDDDYNNNDSDNNDDNDGSETHASMFVLFRPSSQLLLCQPATRINFQSKAFSVTAPADWNSLSPVTKSSATITIHHFQGISES